MISQFFSRNSYKNTVFLLWGLICLLQASFTELMDDEAYYWVYSNNLDWGYFDHPPMIALLIKIGYTLFASELGVRLLMVLMNVGTLYLIDRMMDQKNYPIFYWMLAGMGAMQIGGMLAVPDIPLIFFGTLYFYTFRRFIQNATWINTIALAFSMAFMFYSKYHGILLVFFTLLAYTNLLRNPKYYVAVLLTSLLYVPHLIWQYQHDFPSLQFHLVERNAASYHISFTLDYILGQVLLFGPLAGWLFLYLAFRSPTQGKPFERGLKCSLIGVLVFFLISTFKGRVEANWTVMVFAPLFLLAHQQLVAMPKAVRVLKILAVPTVLIVLVARIYLVYDFIPHIKVRPEFHHNKEWTAAIAQKAAGRPVVFTNSYQNPSKYMFYQPGTISYSLNGAFSRRSQYNFWLTEKDLWGKDVLLVSNHQPYIPYEDSLKRAHSVLYYHDEAPYYSYSGIEFQSKLKEVRVKAGTTLIVSMDVVNHYRVAIPDVEVPVGYTLRMGREERIVGWTESSLQEVLQAGKANLRVKIPNQKGSYLLKAGIKAPGGAEPTHNSQGIKIIVE